MATFGPLSSPEPTHPEAASLARELRVTQTFADVLLRLGRGQDLAATRQFLLPKLAHLSAPHGMLGRSEAAERIAYAIRHGEKICVFGDYDCDGMTSAAVMTDGIRRHGGEVSTQLASRFEGGYGLSDAALDGVLAHNPRLLITCDCGSADHPRVQRAADAGVDVVVIDHHLVPPEPLPALAFLNPHQPGCGFAFKGMASCGLALSVIAELRAKLGAKLDIRRYLGWVAIGTIADVAPLTSDNRALVRAGLERISRSASYGVYALAEQCKVPLSMGISAQDIGFKFAPRLNAPGRLGSPAPALDLLLSEDLQQARSRAAVCEQANQRRREIQDRMIQEAQAQVRKRGLEDAPALVLFDAGWHHGVVGIVAGRLANEFDRPVLVAGEGDGVAKASVRSAKGVCLVTALGECQDLLLGYGGHAKAAGASFKPENAAELQEAFAAAASALETGAPAERGPRVALVPGDDLRKLVADLALLEPCGEGNRLPQLCLPPAKVLSARPVRGGHLKLRLEVAGDILGAFAPGLGELAGELGEMVQVEGHLRHDTFRGGGALEVQVEHLAPASS